MIVDDAINNIKSALEGGRLAQAYLVIGSTRGAGKELVDGLLQLLFCEAQNKPCGECRGCRDALTHTNADLLWIEPQKKSRQISIAQIRELQQRMFQTSFAGGWKACAVMAADRLGPEASNAFLKTLEEPPGKSIFFLVTESPQFLLPTIISRCQRLTVSDSSDFLPEEWSKQTLGILAGYESSGSVEAFACSDRLVDMLKKIKDAAKDEIMEFASDQVSEEEDETLDARVNSRYREIRTGVLNFMLNWYRDILLHHCGGDDNVLYNSSELSRIADKSKTLSYRQALRNVEIIAAMNRQLESNISEGAVFEYGFSRIS